MTRWMAYSLFVLIVSFIFVGCAEEEVKNSSGKQTTKVVPKVNTQKISPKQKQTKPEQKEKPKFVYDSEGRRDPFLPLTTIRKSIKPVEVEPQTPLQTYDLPQLKLIGIIVGKGKPKAMVIAPDGKSYILSKGVKVGKKDGVVKEVTPEAVIVEEKYYDFAGNIVENIEEITVPKREGI